LHRQDVLRNFRFKVEIDGILQAGFSEVSIGEHALDAAAYRDGEPDGEIHKISGINKSTDVILKRGVAHAPALASWLASFGQSSQSRLRNRVRIHLSDESGRHVASFEVIRPLPVKVVAPDLNGKGTDVAIELLELANEGVRRVRC